MTTLALAADAAQVLEAFWRGSVGTGSAFVNGTLVRAVPLMIIGVGISLAFRAGVFNLGGEGQLLFGGVAAAIVGLSAADLGFATAPVALAAAAAAGAAWASVAAILRTRFGVLEVISTIMLNFVALNLVSYLVRGPLQEPTRIYPQTATIGESARLWQVIPQTRLHFGIVIALAAAIAAWWVLTRTAAGFRLRTVGASPSAAVVSGRVDVPRVTAAALIASGALAGLAGGIEVTGVTYALYENLSPGYGFSAIAVAILAKLHPLRVIGTALLFAILETGALGMQRDAGVPAVVATALEAVAILVVVATSGGVPGLRWKRDRAPAAAEAGA
jgi:ABC-type uncharacterized transport system permease subunit